MKRAALSIVIVFAVTLFLSGCIDQRVTEHEQLIADMNGKISEMESRPVVDARQIIDATQKTVIDAMQKIVHTEMGKSEVDVVEAVLDRLCKYKVEVVIYDHEVMARDSENFRRFINRLRNLDEVKQARDIGVEQVSVAEDDDSDKFTLTLVLPRSSFQTMDGKKESALSNLINSLAKDESVTVDWEPDGMEETCAFEQWEAKLDYVPAQVELTSTDKTEVEIKLVADKLLKGSRFMLNPTHDFKEFASSKGVEIVVDNKPSDTSLEALYGGSIRADERVEITITGTLTESEQTAIANDGYAVYAMTVRLRDIRGKQFSAVTYSSFKVRQERGIVYGKPIPVADPTSQPACYPGEGGVSGTEFHNEIRRLTEGKECVNS